MLANGVENAEELKVGRKEKVFFDFNLSFAKLFIFGWIWNKRIKWSLVFSHWGIQALLGFIYNMTVLRKNEKKSIKDYFHYSNLNK